MDTNIVIIDVSYAYGRHNARDIALNITKSQIYRAYICQIYALPLGI